MGNERGTGGSMSDPRGEFTKRIDEELLLQSAGEAARQAARIDLDLVQRRQRSAVREANDNRLLEEALGSIREVLSSRSEFLADRFSNMIESVDPEGRGVAYRFSASESHPREATLELRVAPNDTGNAIFVESAMAIEESPAINDYITFPAREVPIPRVKRFVEGKIVEFIKAYL